MAVITISRQVASGGDELARRLCALLGYQPFSKTLIVRAAEESGLLGAGEISGELDYSEETLRGRGFLDRLFDRSRTVAQVRVWREDEVGALTMESVPLREESLLALVEHAIRLAYQSGNTVIVGRGGQMVLKEKPDVLHLRVIAPMEIRLQQVRELLRSERNSYTADISLRREAQDWIDTRDAASREYVRRFYDADWDDPALYHLTLNLGLLSMDQAVDLVSQMAVGEGVRE